MPLAIRIVMLLLGLGLTFGPAGYYGWAVWRTEVARGWPQAEGRILKSNVRVVESDRSPREGNSSPSYHPDIVYSYRVAGSDYRGRNVWLTGYDGTRRFDEAADVMDAYPVGSRVRVSYNPADATDSALRIVRPRWEILFISAMGLVWLGAAIFFGRKRAGPVKRLTWQQRRRRDRIATLAFFAGVAAIAGSVIYLMFFF